MNAKMISWLLAVRQSSPFYARRHLAVVPNVSWGLLPWEADLLVCTKTGYLNEIEIKVSMSDWKADFEKPKHSRDWGTAWPAIGAIKRFWYAAPEKLAKRHQELALPTGAGVIAVTEDQQVRILKPAANKEASKLSDKNQLLILRLAALKAWRMAYDPEFDRTDWAAKLPVEGDISMT